MCSFANVDLALRPIYYFEAKVSKYRRCHDSVCYLLADSHEHNVAFIREVKCDT